MADSIMANPQNESTILILEDISPSTLVDAIEQNAVEGVEAWAHWPGIEIHKESGFVWTMSHVPFFVFNSVVQARSTADLVETTIEKILSQAKARNVALASWIVPSTQPPDFGNRLKAVGFARTADVWGMAADLRMLDEKQPKPEGLAVSRVGDLRALRAWSQLIDSVNDFSDFVAEAWFEIHKAMGVDEGLPWIHYIANLDGRPVAASSRFLGAGVAGIHSVANLPEARRQGIGAAVTLEPLLEARRLGYRIGTLFSSKMAVEIYRKLGFKDYCVGSIYLRK